jgi:hypothetical protein
VSFVSGLRRAQLGAERYFRSAGEKTANLLRLFPVANDRRCHTDHIFMSIDFEGRANKSVAALIMYLCWRDG